MSNTQILCKYSVSREKNKTILFVFYFSFLSTIEHRLAFIQLMLNNLTNKMNKLNLFLFINR